MIQFMTLSWHLSKFADQAARIEADHGAVMHECGYL